MLVFGPLHDTALPKRLIKRGIGHGIHRNSIATRSLHILHQAEHVREGALHIFLQFPHRYLPKRYSVRRKKRGWRYDASPVGPFSRFLGVMRGPSVRSGILVVYSWYSQ
jgi:hypothetical protein